MKSETISLQTIIKELNFLKKTVVIRCNASKKRFIDACKQIDRKKEKIPDPQKMHRNNVSTKSFGKRKHC